MFSYSFKHFFSVCVFFLSFSILTKGQEAYADKFYSEEKIYLPGDSIILSDSLNIEKSESDSLNFKKGKNMDIKQMNYLDFYYYLPRETRGYVPASMTYVFDDKKYRFLS